MYQYLRSPALVIGVPFVVLLLMFWFVCDDAYITWRYARNVARGAGLRYNLGHHTPVEGYSNFLWLWPAVICELLGLSPARWIPLLSAGISGSFLGGFWWFLRREARVSWGVATVAALGLALSPAWLTWSTSGLATVPFAVLLSATFYAWVVSPSARGWLVGAACAVGVGLIRAEGTAWVGVLAVLAIAARFVDLERDAFKQWAIRMGLALVAVTILLGAYHGWRYSWFGDLVPNTARVKVGFGPERLERGVRYLAIHYLTLPGSALWFLGLLRVWHWRRGAGTALGLMSIGVPAYCVAVGGDYMPFGRLLVAGLPFAAATAAIGLERWVHRWPGARGVAMRVALLGVLLDLAAGFGAHLVPRTVLESLNVRLTDRVFMNEAERLANMRDNTEGFLVRGQLLKERLPVDARIVAQAIGAVGYETDLYVYDQYGLVTREVAERVVDGTLEHSPGHDKLVDAGFFAEHDPDLLHHKVLEDSENLRRIVRRVMNRWDVPPDLRARYAPEMERVTDRNGKAGVLLWVRRVEANEDADAMWNRFYDAL